MNYSRFLLPKFQQLNFLLHSSSRNLQQRIPFLDVRKDFVTLSEIRLELQKDSFSRKNIYHNEAISLIPETLKNMKKDVEFQQVMQDLRTKGKEKITLEEKKRRRRSLEALNLPSFMNVISELNNKQKLKQVTKNLKEKKRQKEETSSTSFDESINFNYENICGRLPTRVFQINIGLYCNQACSHCHVESSPKRTKEMMTKEILDRCIQIIRNSPSIEIVDITGGAPELHQLFRYFIEEINTQINQVDDREVKIIDRCNLTVLTEPGQGLELAGFLAKNNVHVIASLPCYEAKNVNMQRGRGVFQRSITGLQMLNQVGYGQSNEKSSSPFLQLDLVFNPTSPTLPPPSKDLEKNYKKKLSEDFGISFNNLITITNMPIKRYADFLHRTKALSTYMKLLVENFNEDTVPHLMCRNYLSVDYKGYIYDCDFNQQLGLGILNRERIQSTKNNESKVNYKYRENRFINVFDINCTDDLPKLIAHPSMFWASQPKAATNDKITISSSPSPAESKSSTKMDFFCMDSDIHFDSHCFGCTAGKGSSCAGAVL